MSIPVRYHGRDYDVPERGSTFWAANVTPLLVGFARDLNALVTLVGGVPVLALPAASISLAAGATLTPSQLWNRIQGDGGAVVLSTGTAIADGLVDGQLLLLTGEHADNTVMIPSGANTRLNGDARLGLGCSLFLAWSASTSEWCEIARNF